MAADVALLRLPLLSYRTQTTHDTPKILTHQVRHVTTLPVPPVLSPAVLRDLSFHLLNFNLFQNDFESILLIYSLLHIYVYISTGCVSLYLSASYGTRIYYIYIYLSGPTAAICLEKLNGSLLCYPV